MTRRFNRRQHIVLYLASDGYCEMCGKELKPSWHADHIEPWSRGGSTDVVNGQALCPTCNLKKGDTCKTNDRHGDGSKKH
jgi:5-methylcytosine-specific restriction endonuclease McrA